MARTASVKKLARSTRRPVDKLPPIKGAISTGLPKPSKQVNYRGCQTPTDKKSLQRYGSSQSSHFRSYTEQVKGEDQEFAQLRNRICDLENDNNYLRTEMKHNKDEHEREIGSLRKEVRGLKMKDVDFQRKSENFEQRFNFLESDNEKLHDTMKSNSLQFKVGLDTERRERIQADQNLSRDYSNVAEKLDKLPTKDNIDSMEGRLLQAFQGKPIVDKHKNDEPHLKSDQVSDDIQQDDHPQSKRKPTKNPRWNQAF